jgi:hypothetical protein
MTIKLNISKRSISILSVISLILIVICLFNLTSLSHSISKNPTTKEYQEQYNIKANDLYRKNSKSTCLANTANVGISKEEWNQCLEVGTSPEYYLSIVIVTRMDDYAG